MRFILVLFSFVLSGNMMAQKKMLIDLNVGILYPIGSNELKTTTTEINGLTIPYYSQKKLEHPSFNVLGDIAYPLTKKMAIGIQTGFYLRFKEQYTTYAQRNSIFIPLQITAKYNLLKITNKWLGLNLAAGLIFFDFTDVVERYHNSTSYNASLSYPVCKNGLIKLGIEKQIDHVSYDVQKLYPYLKYEIFDYNLNRLFIHLSYSIKIKQ